MKSPYWQVLRRVTAYDSPWVRIHRDDVRLPDGTIIEGHHVIDIPRQAVGVVPVDDDGRILLIEHYRFITDTLGWEIPAGLLDKGETNEAGAARELQEETGHTAAQLRYLGQYYPSNGSSTQTFNVYVGTGLKKSGEITDTNEISRVAWFTPAELAEMLRTNQICNGLSLTALLWYLWDASLKDPGAR